jgi:hypothetical protein
MNLETIIEAVCVTLFLSILAYMACPFSWDSAHREVVREWKAGNLSAKMSRKWYGWIVKHEKKNKGDAR